MIDNLTLMGVEEDVEISQLLASAMEFIASCKNGAVVAFNYPERDIQIPFQNGITSNDTENVKKLISSIPDKEQFILEISEIVDGGNSGDIAPFGSRGGRRWRGGRVRSG